MNLPGGTHIAAIDARHLDGAGAACDEGLDAAQGVDADQGDVGQGLDVDQGFDALAHREFTGAELARLRALRTELLDGEAAVCAWLARRSEIMRDAAQIAEAVSARGPRSSRISELPYRAIAAELAAALRVSDRTVQRDLSEAPRLIENFPATHAALAAARISGAHVHAIVTAGQQLPDASTRGAYEREILPIAEREAPSRTRHLARVVAERAHPRSFPERHASAAACRGVRVVDLEDGMSELIATLPSVFAHGALDRLTQMARSVHEVNKSGQRDAMRGVTCVVKTGGGCSCGVDGGGGEGCSCGDGGGDGRGHQGDRDDQGERGSKRVGSSADARSIDELRADIFADLLLASAPVGHAGPTGLGAIRARVHVTVPVLSLVGRAETPATLAGVGPMDAGTARELAGASSGWDRILTDPISGAVLAVDRYTPSVQLKRTLQVRDQHCRFPGCRQSVDRSDIDHTIDFALGGKTCEENLAHLCRRHHTLKHATSWTVVQKPGGVLEWTSPTGQVYPDVPTSSVMFKPTEEWNHAFAEGSPDGDDPPPF
ncbi:MAG: DUF222 domain-containing protein [Microbacteriaceae bacterium]